MNIWGCYYLCLPAVAFFSLVLKQRRALVQKDKEKHFGSTLNLKAGIHLEWLYCITQQNPNPDSRIMFHNQQNHEAVIREYFLFIILLHHKLYCAKQTTVEHKGS